MAGSKWEKLRAYAQKDYSEFIDFPVELVGKDGVIRRYTYEESLLVYQKRIESAHQRYRDPDLAEAEIDHCYKRIEQLKRSWRQLSASRAADGESSYRAPGTEGDAAEACKRFVRSWYVKALAGRVPPSDEPVNVYLTLLERQGALRVFYVSLAGSNDGHLLYVFSFAGSEEEGDRARHQFAQYVQILESNARLGGDGVERLLGKKSNDRYGFILTGSSAELLRPSADPATAAIAGQGGAVSRERLRALIDQEPDNAEAYYALGVACANDNDHENALHHLTMAVTLQPFHLGAHLALASLCDQLESYEHAEPYCLMATRYFPNNARVHFNLGVLYMRQDRHEEALEPLKRALELDPEDAQTRYFVECLERGEKPDKLDPAAQPGEVVESTAAQALAADFDAEAESPKKAFAWRVPATLLLAAPIMLLLGYFAVDSTPIASVGALGVLLATIIYLTRK